jgi:hypothetical protein
MPDSIWSISPLTGVLGVGGRHAGRVVDHEDESLAIEPGPFPAGPQQREHCQGDEQ